ncbi:MAG: hypothetical protein SGI88_04880 [Candidatus Hydrogenedentes bacterium]|nr:hypothetical protein [Candidatus Hydrogenedentota bacterium]
MGNDRDRRQVDDFGKVASVQPETQYGLLVLVAVIGGVAVISPPKLSAPLLFLALAVFGWWSANAVAQGREPSPRAKGYLGLAPSALLFIAALFTGPLSLLCFAGSAACYWHWLLVRSGSRR